MQSAVYYISILLETSKKLKKKTKHVSIIQAAQVNATKTHTIIDTLISINK